MRTSRILPALLSLAITLGVTAGLSATAWANHPQPAPDISKMDYTPIGAYKPGQPIPTTQAPPTNPNPSGKWVAYDTNVYESLNLPQRQPGDTSANDPLGNGGQPYGFCPQEPPHTPWGKCANHQLEYLAHFEKAMREILGPFGVVVQRYEFTNTGSATRGKYLDTATGRGINISATVPGADHPDETVLVSGHYDFTDSGPAAAWDSSEGHTEVIRIAKIMADYWRSTGTRPSATVRFIPWDGEESGTFGSADYVRNVIPPGEEAKVRGYFNMDPCAGAYPAYRNGNGENRINETLQLANPAAAAKPEIKTRMNVFNKRALEIIEEVFNHLDDTIETAQGPKPIFVSDAEAKAQNIDSQRDEIVPAVGGLKAFSSDYRNFEAIGVPIFNLFPDMFGPHADNSPASAEGVGILHTPRDNLQSLNQLTSQDQTGLTASEGWAKGMEMCAHMEGWYMLQPEMGGTQLADDDVVAYFEALPNEAVPNQPVNFNATGSYRYTSAMTRDADPDLAYHWDFGDGTSGTGATVQHPYAAVGKYPATLTVSDPQTGKRDTMIVPITVQPSTFPSPVLKPPAPEDEDGQFELSWTFAGTRAGHTGFSVEEAGDYTAPLNDNAEGDLGKLWTPSVPGSPQVQPWQKSNGSPAPAGNKFHSGGSSYWTGAVPPAPAPANQESILTLKAPITVPATAGEASLSYWSLFQNEGDDSGVVEVSLPVAQGAPEAKPAWETVDTTTGIFDPQNPQAAATSQLTLRRIDLTPYRGKQLLVRFRYILGPDDRAASQPAGWYIDDIKMSAGTWKAIGTTAKDALKFMVPGTPAGTYGYRVRGVYNDGVVTGPSNEEPVKVTKGSTRGSTGGSKGGGSKNGAGGVCAPRAIRSLRVRMFRGGLRIVVGRRGSAAVRVELFAITSGRRIVRDRRVARIVSRSGTITLSKRAVRRLPAGVLIGTVTASNPRGGRETRTIVLQRRGPGVVVGKAFVRPASCGLLRNFALSNPVFGGVREAPLKVTYRVGERARILISVTRGKRLVLRSRAVARPGRTLNLLLSSRRFRRRGEYVVTITVRGAKRTVRASLRARRI
jgi:hypothetical protein